MHILKASFSMLLSNESYSLYGPFFFKKVNIKDEKF